jgi:hypothetical protein
VKPASPARAQYPKDRPQFFAQKFIRLMVKTALATTLGPEAFTLLAVIATCEDAIRYRRAVNFYNGQLMPLVGVKTWNRLERIRQACVDTGWLFYVPPKRGSHRPGEYWVTVPLESQDLGDAPIDEDALSVSEQPTIIRSRLSNEDQPVAPERFLSSKSDDQPNDQLRIATTINRCASYPAPEPVPDPSEKTQTSPSPPSLPSSVTQDGDGDGIKNSSDRSGPPPPKPPGWWTGHIDAKRLRNPKEVAEMYRDAVKSGLIQHTKLNGLRVVALSLQSLTANNPGGYFVSHVERQSWNYLAPENVIEAARRLSGDGLSFTPDELRMARELSA